MFEPITENIIETIEFGRRQDALTGNSGLMYNAKTGQIAKRDMKYLWINTNWYTLSNKNYPIFRDNVYIRDSEDFLEEEKEQKQLTNIIYVVPCGVRFSTYGTMKQLCQISVPDNEAPGCMRYEVNENYMAEFNEYQKCKGCSYYPVRW